MTTAVVVTTVNPPNPAMRVLSDGCVDAGHSFIVVGDTATPGDFRLDGCRYLDIGAQYATGFRLARLSPTRHYARKNIGYLQAIAEGAKRIVETDDDNIARDSFFAVRPRKVSAAICRNTGWVNVYRYFSDADIWPRGFPLDAVRADPAPFQTLPVDEIDCPIQQGLANGDPDVDAVYRLLFPLPQTFRTDRRLALGPGAWCPFNSQNTAWWPEAFPLLYLPAHCSFRMCDIWRSLVAQRIAWENGWAVLFHEPTVYQERNAHDLMCDFADEVPGYLHNNRIRHTLEDLPLAGTTGEMAADLHQCYEALIRLGLIASTERSLLDAWLADLEILHAAA